MLMMMAGIPVMQEGKVITSARTGSLAPLEWNRIRAMYFLKQQGQRTCGAVSDSVSLFST